MGPASPAHRPGTKGHEHTTLGRRRMPVWLWPGRHKPTSVHRRLCNSDRTATWSLVSLCGAGQRRLLSKIVTKFHGGADFVGCRKTIARKPTIIKGLQRNLAETEGFEPSIRLYSV